MFSTDFELLHHRNGDLSGEQTFHVTESQRLAQKASVGRLHSYMVLLKWLALKEPLL